MTAIAYVVAVLAAVVALGIMARHVLILLIGPSGYYQERLQQAIQSKAHAEANAAKYGAGPVLAAHIIYHAVLVVVFGVLFMSVIGKVWR